jgi:hypothetical protein
MKKKNPAAWTDDSPVPPVQPVAKPNFPVRSGVGATGTAILIFVALFCVFQYWLLTATLEAYHAGDEDLPLGAFLASLGCFVLASGLTILGEVALIKQQDYLRKSQGGPLQQLPVDYNPNTIGQLRSEDRNPYKGNPAGGGDAG